MKDYIAEDTLSPADEERYICAYLPVVHRIVKQLAPQTSSILSRDDMEQIAIMGLLTSLRRYGQPDNNFAAYAAPRIRGAILDELRQLDWRPRRLRQKFHKLSDAIRQLSRELGREPGFDDLQARLSITAAEYQEYLMLDSARTLESLDELLNGDKSGIIYDSRTLEEEMVNRHTLETALASLDEREKLIISLYYQHELSLKEIACVLDITEARVCQLNKKITHKIQSFFREQV